MSKVLIIGSGGREHALAWSLARSARVSKLFVAPGSAGTIWPASTGSAGERVAACRNVDLAADDIDGLIDFALTKEIDFTVVGPEQPLSMGIVDRFQERGLRVFGPPRQAAQLESSKAFAKQLMSSVNVPTADYRVFTDYEPARDYLRSLGKPAVIKASGLAAGKGVLVCHSLEESLDALGRVMIEGEFGRAGDEVVIEELLQGPELSLMAFCDGNSLVMMPPARDHKRAFDGDLGPNTGGMGVVAPIGDLPDGLVSFVEHEVMRPVMAAMTALGTPYAGVLYAGLMLTSEGPKVLEFNCRFGDPETQAVLPLLQSDLFELLWSCSAGTLEAAEVEWKDGSCASVVLASGGYPGDYERGHEIFGLDDVAAIEGVQLFHAGTAVRNGKVVSSGGRVLAASATASDLPAALAKAYEAIEKISFAGSYYRRDIGRFSDSVAAARPDKYAQAGVDIDAGNRAAELISTAVRSTHGPEVISGIGTFGGLFDASQLKSMNRPVLVSSTDGVGTKSMVAARMGRWDTVGQDLVNHCVNDILAMGARPLFFLDYVASSRIDPERIATIVGGMALACRQAGIAIVGGETAEMPGVYQPLEHDLVGTIVGVVEHGQIVTGKEIRPGDLLLGLPSTGLHTNGYSLARETLEGLDWEEIRPDLGGSIGDLLLRVHASYLDQVQQLRVAGVAIRGLAHITGGGLVDNLPRILPASTDALIQLHSWPVPPIFPLIKERAGLERDEMVRVFNMGLGMLAVIPAADAEAALAALPGQCFVVGRIEKGSGQVRFRGP